MNKIFYTIISFFSISQTVFAGTEKTIEQKMKGIPNNTLGLNSSKYTPLQTIFKSIESLTYTLLGIIAIGTFMFFGIKLITSRGNEEAFKKAKTGLMYAITGLAIIPLAMALVKLATTLKL